MRDFNYTVNVLVKAYLNNSLEHGKCAACAVGNIIADCKGITLLKGDNGHSFDSFDTRHNVYWHYVFMTDESGQEPFDDTTIGPDESLKRTIKGIKQIEATGYSIIEMARIELAFEKAPGRPFPWDGFNEEWMFNGLMAVVDVLAEIHGIDLTQKEAAKLLFVK